MSYAPQGILITFTENEILRMRDTALKLITENKTIMTYAGEGTSATREFTMPIPELMAEITFALQSRWPAKYGWRADRVKNWFI